MRSPVDPQTLSQETTQLGLCTLQAQRQITVRKLVLQNTNDHRIVQLGALGGIQNVLHALATGRLTGPHRVAKFRPTGLSLLLAGSE